MLQAIYISLFSILTRLRKFINNKKNYNMKKSTLLLLALTFAANHFIQAQNSLLANTYTNICVSSSDNNQSEINISLDKANPDNLILCSNIAFDGGDSI